MPEQQYDAMLAFARIYQAHLDAEIEKLGFDTGAEGLDSL